MEASEATTGRGVLAAARRLAAAVAAGALAGVLVGGVGGRIAMLVLRLTSDPALHGRLTDDGFTIGIVSASTLFLLAATAVLGILGGIAYLLVRPWLPERARSWLFAALAGVVGGARIARPGGIDFTLLDPLPLALAMFVAIPAAGGFLTSRLAERFLREGSAFRTSWAALALLLLLAPIALGFGGLLGLVAIAAVGVLVVFALVRGAPDLARVWSSAPMTWLGRTALLAVAAVSTVELASDVVAIL